MSHKGLRCPGVSRPLCRKGFAVLRCAAGRVLGGWYVVDPGSKTGRTLSALTSTGALRKSRATLLGASQGLKRRQYQIEAERELLCRVVARSKENRGRLVEVGELLRGKLG